MTVFDDQTNHLLRAVAQSHAERQSVQVGDLASQILCWDEAIEAAHRHGVLPLLYSQLAANEKVIPPNALAQARSAFEHNAFHCFANAAELLEILKLFHQNGLAAIPFKGVVLASQLYGDITLRAAGDLDLLIFRRDLESASALLQERGYERKPGLMADDSGEVFEHGFERTRDGMVVELRWRLEMSHPTLSRVRFLRDLGIEWVWTDRAVTSFAGTQVTTLAPEHNVLMLCMHGSKHLWSRLIWVVDVARAIESDVLDWDRIVSEAKRTGLQTALSLGVLLAHKMTGAEVPHPVSQWCLRNRGAAKLAVYFNENLLKQPGQRPPGILPYNVRLMETRDRLRLLLSQRTFRPNERDRAFIKLPKGLEPLYYIVRPLRILVDRSAR